MAKKYDPATSLPIFLNRSGRPLKIRYAFDIPAFRNRTTFVMHEGNHHMITYNIENNLTVEEFRDVLIRSTLGERRPVDDPGRLQGMLEHADLIVTARDGGLLVGISRALTDFFYCTYLSDLAVDQAYQRQGIGKELIRQTKSAAPRAKLILVSAPAAVHYYPKIGMMHHEFCYYLDDVEKLK